MAHSVKMTSTAIMASALRYALCALRYAVSYPPLSFFCHRIQKDLGMVR
jgi:hypothetical protein